MVPVVGVVGVGEKMKFNDLVAQSKKISLNRYLKVRATLHAELIPICVTSTF